MTGLVWLKRFLEKLALWQYIQKLKSLEKFVVQQVSTQLSAVHMKYWKAYKPAVWKTIQALESIQQARCDLTLFCLHAWTSLHRRVWRPEPGAVGLCCYGWEYQIGNQQFSTPARTIRGMARRRDTNPAILAKRSDLENQDSEDGSIGTDRSWFFLTKPIDVAHDRAIVAWTQKFGGPSNLEALFRRLLGARLVACKESNQALGRRKSIDWSPRLHPKRGRRAA
jgi:hypothetical protein